MQNIPKQLRSLVREWAGVAHERDLRRALGELRIQFGRWERGEIGSLELNEFVHQFHHGASREIWTRYDTSHLEPAVAGAVAEGVLRKDELPPELMEHIARWIEFYESDKLLS